MCATERDIVLFLGAGFSWHAKLPTMSGFGDHIKKSHDQFCGQPGYEAICEALAPAKATSLAFMEWCTQNDITVCSDNMEDLFCKAEDLRRSDVGCIDLPGHGRVSPRVIADALFLRFWKMLQECAPATKLGKDRRRPYCSFFGQIAQEDLARRMTVVTTNIDLLFEYFAANRNIPMGVSLVECEQCDMLSEKEDKRSFLRCCNAPFSLCKIHGSINFFRAPDGRLIIDDRWAPTSRQPELFGMRTVSRLWADCCGPLVPEIVPPTLAEPPDRPCFTVARECAETALRNAKAIIFIGYSLPPSDKHIREMIGSAIANREGDGELKVWVVDPDTRGEVWPRYVKLFHDCASRLQPLQKGFAQAVEDDFARIFGEIA